MPLYNWDTKFIDKWGVTYMIQTELVVKAALSEKSIDGVHTKFIAMLSHIAQILRPYKTDGVLRIIKNKANQIRKDYSSADQRGKKDLYNLLYVGILELEEFKRAVKKGIIGDSPQNIHLLLKKKYPTLLEVSKI